MVVEEWRPIPGWPKYEASNLGRIRGSRGIKTLQVDKNGYFVVNLREGKRNGYYAVHRLVCMSFHGDVPFEGAQVLHRNHDKTNCKETNLKWGTLQENIEHKTIDGRAAKGETHGMSKITWDIVREIRRRREAGETGSSLAREFGITPTCVVQIVKNRTWKE